MCNVVRSRPLVILQTLRSGWEYDRSVSISIDGQGSMKRPTNRKVNFVNDVVVNAIDVSDCDDEMTEVVEKGKSNVIDEETHEVSTNEGMNVDLVIWILICLC